MDLESTRILFRTSEGGQLVSTRSLANMTAMSGGDSALLRHPPLGTGRDTFASSGSGRYEALDSSRTGNSPRTLCLPTVPPKRVSNSLRIFAVLFRFAKYWSQSG